VVTGFLPPEIRQRSHDRVIRGAPCHKKLHEYLKDRKRLDAFSGFMDGPPGAWDPSGRLLRLRFSTVEVVALSRQMVCSPRTGVWFYGVLLQVFSFRAGNVNRLGCYNNGHELSHQRSCSARQHSVSPAVELSQLEGLSPGLILAVTF